MDIKSIKTEIREEVWRRLEENDIARFPKPIHGRIPNFKGAEEAARLITSLDEFKDAKVLKVNPDAPQRMVRYHALTSNKILIMPSPRIRSGFIILKDIIKPRDALRASSISGAFQYGRVFDINEDIKIDAIVLGSVAVSREGARLGKGEGYAELEYAIFRELNMVDEDTPIITSIHDLQIVDSIPIEEHDLPVDIIVTPKQVIRTNTKIRKPKGIIWSKVSKDMLEKMPILLKVKALKGL